MKNFWNSTTTFMRILIIGGLAAGLYFGVTYLIDSGVIPNKDDNSLSENEINDLKADGATEIDVCVVTWGGYIGGQYYNNGFKANPESRFLTDQNLIVNFHVVDDFDASRKGFIAGEYDLLWQTTGAFTTEVEGLQQSGIDPVIVFQADWSRGGDAIVARKGINNITDLTSGSTFGKYTVAVAPMTPSHTFLLKTLEAEGKSINSIEIKEVPSAIDAADLFKAGEVDAAVVWSPDDIACTNSQKGSSVIINTETATNIIADVFYAKKEFVDKNTEALQRFVTGWMIGAAEINENKNGAKDKAASILADGLNISKDDAIASINNVRLCTYGDNMNFFGLNDDYNGVTGENLYTTMGKTYNKIGYAPKSLPSWRNVTDLSIINGVNLNGSMHLAEGGATFNEVTQDDYVAEAVTTKPVSITFNSGSSTLDNGDKYTIDKEFLDIAKSFSGAKIRVEGNTDNTGSRKLNETLSYERAQAVVDYLVSEYGFDRNRFVVVGNGPLHAIEDGITGSNEDYRRTDFQLLK
jgi:NitT/TauT family transport system substrate-binding protein